MHEHVIAHLYIIEVTIKQEYKQFLEENFNGLKIKMPLFYNWENSLRFDLQVGDTNTEEYFKEVNKRSTALFRASFSETDKVFIVLNQYKIKRSKIRSSNYAFKQIAALKKSEVDYSTVRQLYEPDDMWNRAISKVAINSINYENILKAIANTDFSREPRIDSQIFFINIDKKLLFNMYDDRGLDIAAKDIETLRPLYTEFNTWLLDYDRSVIDQRMKKNKL
ncbi:DUF3885 domain-containing protein [Pontibacter mangrovi]|uniref:DUF3885 domain-containing protein n=1 Tax=Pontibacter mangrovi TaxID=2589816 RepID=A0A501W0Z3_9BACT|nr:DUF3885 domain-containing protein [Pontibacter mangrovi]TPE39286.1 DUF3885 domain-containing protein [Pontibacter mangrovi]